MYTQYFTYLSTFLLQWEKYSSMPVWEKAFLILASISVSLVRHHQCYYCPKILKKDFVKWMVMCLLLRWISCVEQSLIICCFEGFWEVYHDLSLQFLILWANMHLQTKSSEVFSGFKFILVQKEECSIINVLKKIAYMAWASWCGVCVLIYESAILIQWVLLLRKYQYSRLGHVSFFLCVLVVAFGKDRVHVISLLNPILVVFNFSFFFSYFNSDVTSQFLYIFLVRYDTPWTSYLSYKSYMDSEDIWTCSINPVKPAIAPWTAFWASCIQYKP